MSGFPTLKPAFTVRLRSGTPMDVGGVATGGTLQVVPVISGTVKSEPEYPVHLDAEVVYGSDHVRVEPGQSHVRIGVNAVLRNSDGCHLSYSYKGIIETDASFMAIFTGSPNAKTTDYGNAFTQIQFETGAEQLKPLEHGIFVGSAHFVIEENGTMIVETKVSQVSA